MKCDRFYFNAAGSENRRAQFPVGFILKSAINPLIWEE
jgi:hypothetical protein